MAFQISSTGRLLEDLRQPQIGDVLGHGIVMRVETIRVADFIAFAISGGIPLHGFDQILIDERFVVEAPSTECDDDEDTLPTIIDGNVFIIWVNAL